MRKFNLADSAARAEGARFMDVWLGPESPFFHVAVHVWERKGEEWPLHNHPQDELFYYAEGEVLVSVEEEGEVVQEVVPPGSWVFVPGGVRHGARNVGQSRSVIMTFNSPNLGWREE